MKYVYGIVPSQQAVAAQLQLTGLHGQPLQTVACPTASPPSSARPCPMITPGCPSSSWSKCWRSTSRRRNASCRRRGRCLPVKFGTMLSACDVEKLLRQSKHDLEQALARMEEQVELEVLVMSTAARLCTDCAASADCELHAAAEGRTPEEVQHIQMVIGALVKQLLDTHAITMPPGRVTHWPTWQPMWKPTPSSTTRW